MRRTRALSRADGGVEWIRRGAGERGAGNGSAGEQVLGCVTESRSQQAIHGAESVRWAVEMFVMVDSDGDHCPTLEELVGMRHIREERLIDPWGHPYRVQCTIAVSKVDTITVTSAGADGRFDTLDDLRAGMHPEEVRGYGVAAFVFDLPLERRLEIVAALALGVMVIVVFKRRLSLRSLRGRGRCRDGENAERGTSAQPSRARARRSWK